MIDDRSCISVHVRVGPEKVSSRHAVYIGLLVTELVINALKHGFPDGARNGRVTVAYDAAGTAWTLTVADNGIGTAPGSDEPKAGLGTLIIGALAKQLDAKVKVDAYPNHGRLTSFSHSA